MNVTPPSEAPISRRFGPVTILFVFAIVVFVFSSIELYRAWIAGTVSIIHHGEAVLGIFFALFCTLVYINQPEEAL
jgi:hypothetical protein